MMNHKSCLRGTQNRTQTQRLRFGETVNSNQPEDLRVKNSRQTNPKVLIVENPHSCTITATFISGFLNEEAYLVSEDLTCDRVYSIIELVWQQQCNRIITMSCFDEDTGHPEGYWPRVVGESIQYGEYKLLLVNTFVYSDFITRVFCLTKGNYHLTVYHFQFTTWRENGLPIYGAHSLINFVKRVHSIDSEARGPAIVNSLSGGGRVGTYIICATIIQELAICGRTNEAECLKNVTSAAPFLSPNTEQINFLSDVMIEELRIDSSTHPAKLNSPELYNMLQNIDRVNIPQLTEEFKVLCDATEESSEVDEDYEPLPLGYTYVDSFRSHNQFIVTRTPNGGVLEQELFWKCVYDHEVQAIVMLDHFDKYRRTVQYWPNKGAKKYGSMEVKIRALSSYSSKFLLRRFEVDVTNAADKNSNPHKVLHYQLKRWKDPDVYPSNIEEYMFLISHICELQQLHQHPEESKPAKIIVHCRDGGIRSALFCAATHLIEDIDVRCEVNPLLAARVISRNKKNFFRTIKEYQSLYKIALEYLKWKNKNRNPSLR